MKISPTCLALILLFIAPVAGAAQPREPLEGPRVLEHGGQQIRVVPIIGLERPWALAILPSGDILVTERPGRLRIIRDGLLDPKPISGLPDINVGAVNSGLMDIALHPDHRSNRMVYFTYSKPMVDNPHPDFQGERDAATVTLARARFDGGSALTAVEDIFVADAWAQGTSGSRIAFGRDGKIIMTVGMPTRHRIGNADDAQDPGSHAGKVLRLNEDGSVPFDNPFVEREGYRPEIFALGIRNALGLFVHPDTGEIWETENGPMGGDELNRIHAGRNYGWPVVSYGYDYTGNKLGGLSGTLSERTWAPGMEEPFMFWNPSPALAGLTIYTGERFPTWKGHIFIGAMGGSNLGARQLHRVVLSESGLPQSRGNQTLLTQLGQRIRDVKQGPDGLLYLTTDEVDGAVLRIEPVEEIR
ncbi:MAG: PQQ-dependent sugar dehydrogenase [Acidobacteriota bacterium]|nr:PQQ-dependent sugar dehydrogenase [Acidobacteriota bacterium]